MKFFIYLSVVFVLASCSGSAVSKKLASADSLVITFNAANTDSVLKIVTTTEKKAIKKLSQFVAGKESEQFKCGYDGNMTFYSNGQLLLPLVFKYKEKDCRHFLFDMDNKVMSTKMSNEAADFLQNLLDGKGVN